MTELFGALAMSVASTCIAVAILAKRAGDDRRDIQLMAGAGLAICSVGLLLLFGLQEPL